MWRALLVTGLGLGVAVLAGIIGQDLGYSIMVLGPTLLISYPFIMNFYLRNRTFKRVRSGEYYKDKSESKLIDIVNKSVDQYNEAEEKGMMK